MIDLTKNRREVIRVRQREFNGQRIVDVRLFFPGADGEMCPSRKGLSVPLDRATDLADAIRAVTAQENVDDD
ncbi:hypothetical protein A3731_39910 [Roseovarius sp. HI0049]|nr:hypothetical protein A3731_39910 [Roseovarius sp. HI0049]